MGCKRAPGLIKRGGIWHIDKQIRGQRVCEALAQATSGKAETYLARRREELRQATVFGIRPVRSFRQAATKYLEEGTKTTLADDARLLKQLDPFIGELRLDRVHMGSLQPFIRARKMDGVKARTINHALQVVRHILFMAAGEWVDENGLTWLGSATRIKFLPEPDRRSPYPLSWEEQTRLFGELPGHLARMALFKVNTG